MPAQDIQHTISAKDPGIVGSAWDQYIYQIKCFSIETGISGIIIFDKSLWSHQDAAKTCHYMEDPFVVMTGT